jgi:hypothetical protein
MHSEKVELACVVCKLKRLDADGLVNIQSQWPREWRKLGVPAVLQECNHWDAMLNSDVTRTIGELAREKLTRWTAEEVEQAERALYGNPQPRPSRRK